MGAATQLKFVLDKPRIVNKKAEWLAQYSKFSDLEDFNNEYEQMMVAKKKRFNKLQHKILNIVRKHGAKVPGVANASYSTYIKKFEELYGHKVHPETIANTINKAETLGILIKLHGKRIDGSYTANVIIFNRYDEMVAYEIANLKIQEEEIAKRLEEEFATMSPVLNYAHNARVWAEEKARKKAEAEAAAKAAEQKTKRETLYKKLMAFVAAKKINKAQAGEIAKILYGRINEAMKNDAKLSKEQAEMIAWDAFSAVISKKHKNLFALVSWKVKDLFVKFANEYRPTEFARKRSNTSVGRTEQVPDWFDDRNANTSHVELDNMIDFEAERQKVLEKLNSK